MKMVIISLVILLILVGIWSWFHFTSIEPTTTYYYETLTELSILLDTEQWQKAEIDMLYYCDNWQDVRRLWIYFINQEDIDNIDSSILKLDSFIKNHDKTMAQAELEHLRILFNIIKENECFSLENIL